MRSWLIPLIVSLALVTAPAILNAGPERPAAAERADRPARRPASSPELERYAEREKESKDLEKFEGGRITEITLILILLIVVIIVILI